ncbi:MAG: TldD/PmbA family protein [Bacteroidales bacterium]|nr:TldD/PmbA family protein [Bacteroidales bacterium]
MITDKELNFVREALETARRCGAQKARATLSKSEEDLVATLDGEVDRVTHCADRSLSLALFVDGRFGSYSTNKLEPEALEAFIVKAVEATRVIAEDPCRDLPDPARCCRDALTGNELGLVDPERGGVTPAERQRIALEASAFPVATPPEYKIVSEEGEYSDSIYETVVMDTNGVCCRHSETSFDYGVEITVESGGEKYSGYWWDASSDHRALDAPACGRRALERAVGQIGSAPVESGRYTAVIDAEMASKVVSPLLRALSGYAIQQNSSFLMDSVGKRLFPDGLTILDVPRTPGQTCSKYFDSEGVATVEAPVIERGVVKEYFINTYMANKMQLAPTIEDATRPKVLPWPRAGLNCEAILRECGSGILVTDFNGGNSNPVTGDFSYGIEGYLFEQGRIVRPVSGMLMTGNFLKLWSRLLFAGDDARPCQTKLVPTLAFSEVDFSG